MNSEILATAFQEAGHDVHLVTWSEDNTSRVFPFQVIRNPEIFNLLQEHYWADMVFENNPCLRLAWPAVFFGRPTVVALNTWVSRIDGRLGIQDRFKLLWLKRARGVIAVSNAIRKHCWPEATVIGNPYAAKLFKIKPTIKKTVPFVFLGRLVSDKGADQAIQVIELLRGFLETQLPPENPLLTIIGEGPEMKKLKRLVQDLKLQRIVCFEGALKGEPLVDCLNKHRFILVPSLWEEPFGNVVLEGMACGCIPIASNGGGLPDAVGEAGLTFERGNLNDMLVCIRNIMSNPTKEKKLRDAASAHLEKHLPEIVSQSYLDLIKTSVAGRLEYQ